MNDEKIIEIETILAYHEQKIEELSEVVTDQWKRIDNLKRDLSRAHDKIAQMAHERKGDEGEGDMSSMDFARQNKPPHY